MTPIADPDPPYETKQRARFAGDCIPGRAGRVMIGLSGAAWCAGLQSLHRVQTLPALKATVCSHRCSVWVAHHSPMLTLRVFFVPTSRRDTNVDDRTRFSQMSSNR